MSVAATQTEVTSSAKQEPSLKQKVELTGVYRSDWGAALKSLGLLLRPWEFGDIEHSFRFFMAAAGPIVKANYDGFLESEHAARLLEEGPDLLKVLEDRAALGKLPEGSFGRAYLDYMNAAGMATAGYFNDKADIGACAAEFGWDEEVTWFMERQAALHDIFHVLSGYDQSIEGEIGVFKFTAGQYAYWFIDAPFKLFNLIPTKFRMLRWRKFLRAALEHGRNAKSIGQAPIEDLLPMQLADVRKELNIQEFDELYPDGLPKGGWLYRKWESIVVP